MSAWLAYLDFARLAGLATWTAKSSRFLAICVHLWQIHILKELDSLCLAREELIGHCAWLIFHRVAKVTSSMLESPD